MGEGRTYRWDKRRQQRQARHQNDTLWFWQIGGLVFICVMGLVFGRFLIIDSIVTAQCAESISHYLRTEDGQSIFQLAVYITLIAGLGWGVIAYRYRRSLRQRVPYIIHGIVALGLVFLLLIFHGMRPSSGERPDGTLDRLFYAADRGMGEWVMGSELERPESPYYHRYNLALTQDRCVWLDGNKIQDVSSPALIDFSDLKHPPRWFGFGKGPLQDLQDLQFYSPLTPDARDRFLAKQECMKTKLAWSCYFVYVLPDP